MYKSNISPDFFRGVGAITLFESIHCPIDGILSWLMEVV
ncbi:hypothetical protein BAOM_4824 [Peribacillus asahii]|uniref:Uncharacterized protein n=1 Tax=Peribacillus asahii TaxID=228899 RepID=A0A3T0KYJ2_9BACI|nr:hypothetical protein BAOM_4824 [Peribacillus asahii]